LPTAFRIQQELVKIKFNIMIINKLLSILKLTFYYLDESRINLAKSLSLSTI